MSRLDQYDIGVTLTEPDGTVYKLGTFDKMTGGAIDSEETKYKPGGMQPQITLGGSVTVNNTTVSRLFRQDRDLPLVPVIKKNVGKGTITIKKQSLTVDGEEVGNPLVYDGKLKMATWPEPDSESSAAALLELEVSTTGTVSA